MKKSVIVFLPSFESGGVERNAVYFANRMCQSGYDVSVLYCRNTETWFPRLHPSIHRIAVGSSFRIPFVHERIADALKMFLLGSCAIYKLGRRGAVIVSFQSNVIAILLARLCQVPVAVRLSNHPESSAQERSLLRSISELGKRVTYRFADKVVANSVELAEAYKALLRRNVEVIHNPVDVDDITTQMSEPCGVMLFSQSAPTLVTVGRLTQQKNFGLLLEAFQRIAKQTACNLLIIGEGGERDSLQRAINTYGLEKRVLLIGHQCNPFKYLRRCDIFVLSSRYEGSPNSLIEALACGLYAVSTDCKSGPAEILSDTRLGRLVPTNDPAAMAEALLDVLLSKCYAENREYRVDHIAHHHSASQVAAKYYCLVDSLFSRSPT